MNIEAEKKNPLTTRSAGPSRLERVMGVEPTTTALARQGGDGGSGAREEVAEVGELRCAEGCTGETDAGVDARIRELVELVRGLPLVARARVAAEVLKEHA